MNNPLVSIIVPCYNQAQYLSEALLSVLEQTYQGWECIIVNDGSPDNTEAVAQEWLEKDTRFKYIYKENGGLSSARNAGITIAEGEFILPLDADDRIGPNYLSLAVDEFKKDSELKVVYCKAEKFGDEVGEWILPEFSLKNLAKKNMIFCCAFFKKSDWESCGGYDVNLIYGIEDWEFWIAILKNGGQVKRLNEVCFYYRIKPISMVKSLNNEKLKFSTEYVNIKHADLFIKEMGSINYLWSQIYENENEWQKKMQSKKFILRIVLKLFFGVSRY